SDELIASTRTEGTLFDLATTANQGTASVQVAGALIVDFQSIENLTGNVGGDRFVLDSDLGADEDDDIVDVAGVLTPVAELGAAVGNGGNDLFEINAGQARVLDGGDGDDDFQLGGNLAATVRGGAGSDELIASTRTEGTLFDLATTANQGTASVQVAGALIVDFQSIENLTGNVGGDRFVLDSDLGADEDDDIVDVAGVLTPVAELGAAVGNGGNDLFEINAGQARVLAGGAGDDDFQLGGNLAATVDGGTGSDELIASTRTEGTLF